jgi:cell shape-determining protein MreC
MKLVYAALLVLIVLLMFPYLGGLINFPKNILFNLSGPVWRLERSVMGGVGDIGALFKTKRALIEENRTLKEELTRLTSLETANVLLEEENLMLKEKLGRPATSKKKVLSSILIRPNRSPYDTLIIDAGTSLGVESGQGVVAGENVALGEVVEVYKNEAKVVMYSSPGIETDILIGGDNISHTAIGLGGGNYEVTLPREVVIESGEIIKIPSLGNIILGVVGEIDSDPADAFQRILFKTPINVQQVKWVEVVIE